MSVLLAVVFGNVALAIGAATGRRGLARGVTAGLAVGAYLLSSLAPLASWLKPWRGLSPWYHALGIDPLRTGLPLWHVGLLIVIALGAVAVAALAFDRRDIAVSGRGRQHRALANRGSRDLGPCRTGAVREHREERTRDRRSDHVHSSSGRSADLPFSGPPPTSTPPDADPRAGASYPGASDPQAPGETSGTRRRYGRAVAGNDRRRRRVRALPRWHL